MPSIRWPSAYDSALATPTPSFQKNRPGKYAPGLVVTTTTEAEKGVPGSVFPRLGDEADLGEAGAAGGAHGGGDLLVAAGAVGA